jgi:hypothetical protein
MFRQLPGQLGPPRPSRHNQKRDDLIPFAVAIIVATTELHRMILSSHCS